MILIVIIHALVWDKSKIVVNIVQGGEDIFIVLIQIKRRIGIAIQPSIVLPSLAVGPSWTRVYASLMAAACPPPFFNVEAAALELACWEVLMAMATVGGVLKLMRVRV